MSFDVFISYAHEDKNAAFMVSRVLEDASIPCWIAPRDISPGQNFAEAIVNAIATCRAMVLIFSSHTSKSRQVKNEVEVAFNRRIPLICLRIEDVRPMDDMSYMLANIHWLDAFSMRKSALDQLVAAVVVLLEKEVDEAPPSVVRPIVVADPEPMISAPEVNDFRVFISAKHEDYQYAQQVYDFLKMHNVLTFFSHESLPELGNSDYREAIDGALDQVQHMIVVTSSPQYVRSEWVKAEWGFFINEKRSGRKTGNLVTITVGGLQPAALPPSLRYYEVLPFGPESLQRVLRYIS